MEEDLFYNFDFNYNQKFHFPCHAHTAEDLLITEVTVLKLNTGDSLDINELTSSGLKQGDTVKPISFL